MARTTVAPDLPRTIRLGGDRGAVTGDAVTGDAVTGDAVTGDARWETAATVFLRQPCLVRTCAHDRA